MKSETFVVFRERAQAARRDVALIVQRELADWSGDWTLTLGTTPPIPLTGLPWWTSLPEPAQRYFSGVGIYARTVSTPPAWLHDLDGIILDLGTVADLAEIRINDRPVGIVWACGQRLTVGLWLKAGTNRVEIRVANNWVNRLVGDAQSGARPTTFTPGTTWRANAPLHRSGLLTRIRLLRDEPR